MVFGGLLSVKSGIYKIVNRLNGKCYVGSARSIDSRWRRHRHDLAHGRHHSLKLQRAFNKHGETAFEFSVIEHVADLAQLVVREQHWIDALGAFKAGYNVLPKAGSALGQVRSDETRAKLRALVISAETRARMSAAKKGVVPVTALAAAIAANTGRPISPETREKIRAANTGKSHTEETRRRLAEINTGKKYGPRSDELRARLSAIQQARVLSDEAKASISRAISESNRRRVVSEETKAKRKATWAAKRAAKEAAE
jgi:group I intron endonuclease